MNRSVLAFDQQCDTAGRILGVGGCLGAPVGGNPRTDLTYSV